MKLFKRIAGLGFLALIILAAVYGSSVFVDRGALARLLGQEDSPQGRQNVVLEPVLLTLPAHGGAERSKPQPVFVSVTLEVNGARERNALCKALPRLVSLVFTDLAPQVTRLMSDAASMSYHLHPRQQERFNTALGEEGLIGGGTVFVHPISKNLPKATCPKPKKEPFQDG